MVSSILVVADDPATRHAISPRLRARDVEVDEVSSAEQVRSKLAAGHAALVILDFGLPGLDAYETLCWLRTFSEAPVVVLSTRGRPSDKVAALDAGADDYVTMPFDLAELLARVRAAGRRSPSTRRTASPIRAGDLEIDVEARQVRVRGRPVHLTKTELSLLEILVGNPGRLLSHEQLLREVWGPGYSTESNYLRTYVGQLRKKLADDAAAPRLILTEPGIGYRWIGDDAAPSP